MVGYLFSCSRRRRGGGFCGNRRARAGSKCFDDNGAGVLVERLGFGLMVLEVWGAMLRKGDVCGGW